MPANAQLSGPTKDPWWNAGAKYIRTGASRGTTTSSGVLVVPTGFPRTVLFALADDEATRTSLTQTGGGPAQTTATVLFFQFLSTDSTSPPQTSARFRVRKANRIGSTSSFISLASSLAGVTARWIAFGY